MTMADVFTIIICFAGLVIWIIYAFMASDRIERRETFFNYLPSTPCPACQVPFGQLSSDHQWTAFSCPKDWFYHDRSRWPEDHRECMYDEIVHVRCPRCGSYTLLHLDGTALEINEAQ